MVEGLIVEDLWNVNVKWSVKYRSRSPSQGTCRVHTLRSCTMQGLVAVGLIVEEILKVDIKCVKGTVAQNIGQGHGVKIPAESVHLGEALCKVGGWRSYTWGDLQRWRKLCQSHCSTKYRSRSLGQGIFPVSTSRRSTKQRLMVLGLKVEEISKSMQNVSKSLERKI